MKYIVFFQVFKVLISVSIKAQKQQLVMPLYTM